MNGDFTIIDPPGGPGMDLIGNGGNEFREWIFDFSTDPDFALFKTLTATEPILKFDELISQMAEDRKQAAIDRAESQKRWEQAQAEIAEDRKQAAIERTAFQQQLEADRAESQQRWEQNQAEIQRISEYLMQQQGS